METLVEKVTELVSRRHILTRLPAAAAAFVLGVFSLSGVTHAACPGGLFALLCCCLCKNPGTCTYSNCACEWFWPCDHRIGQNCYEVECWECFTNPTPCSGSPTACPNAKCSKTLIISVRICEGG
jgi:hypothetical protein